MIWVASPLFLFFLFFASLSKKKNQETSFLVCRLPFHKARDCWYHCCPKRKIMVKTPTKAMSPEAIRDLKRKNSIRKQTKQRPESDYWDIQRHLEKGLSVRDVMKEMGGCGRSIIAEVKQNMNKYGVSRGSLTQAFHHIHRISISFLLRPLLNQSAQVLRSSLTRLRSEVDQEVFGVRPTWTWTDQQLATKGSRHLPHWAGLGRDD